MCAGSNGGLLNVLAVGSACAVATGRTFLMLRHLVVERMIGTRCG